MYTLGLYRNTERLYRITIPTSVNDDTEKANVLNDYFVFISAVDDSNVNFATVYIKN